MYKKLLAFLLVLCLILTGCTNPSTPSEPEDSSEDASEETTGEEKSVETIAQGYGGDVKVKTTFDPDGKITKVEVLEHSETENIGGAIIDKVTADIVDNQTVKPDQTSGATVTNDAITEAVKSAITEAGYKVEDYEKETEEVTGEISFTPGTYEGEATGYGGKLIAEVEVDESSIKNVTIKEHGETVLISDLAIEQIPKDIVQYQTVGVDGIAGATFSSMAVKQAVEAALEKADPSDIKLLTKAAEKMEVGRTEEEKEAEVVIVGAGGAGLSAALSAFDHGAKSVIIVEKMPFAGGNTLRAGGAMNAVDPERQEPQGIEDSPEKHFQQTMEGGHNVADEKLVKIMTDNALDAVHWLEEQGVEFKDEVGSAIGSLWPRSHQTVKPLGSDFIETLQTNFEDKGGELLLNTKATHLINEDGKIVGIKAESPTQDLTIKATKGVILASGGYGADFEMAKSYLTGEGSYTPDNIPEKIESTNHPGATGDGIKMAEEVNANVIDMEHIQLLPMPGDRFGPSINIEDSFFINKEGNRYVREDASRDTLSLAAFEQTDGQYYMITDSQIIDENRKTLSGEDLDVMIDKGTVVEAETLAELAEKIGVPKENLEKTTEEFNKAVDAKKDEFDREVWGKKIEQGPFYATLRYPALHHTMGGVQINEQAQVMNVDGNVIDGLYAAGEVTGGIHGGNRLGGNAITDIFVFGRIAGENIMK